MKKMALLIAFILLGFYSCKTNVTQSPDGFVQIPAGTYTIGEKGHPLNPKRKVEIAAFSISPYEVSNQEFAEFVEASNYLTTAEQFKNALTFELGLEEFEWLEDSTANWRFPFGVHQGGIENKMDHPVTCISFFDVLAYCEWSNQRLPTLEEWEVASRANHSKEFSIQELGNIWLNSDHKETPIHDAFLLTAPVGSFKPNPWGLYDVYGNVFEFCSNRIKVIEDEESLACARGGSWWCSKNACNYFNPTDIGRVHKFASFSNQGFRTVKMNP